MFGLWSCMSRSQRPFGRLKVGLLLASLSSQLLSLPSVASENQIEDDRTIAELTQVDTELSIMMHVLIGKVSHRGSESFNAADETILAEGLGTAPYLGRFFQKMEEACSYHRSAPLSSIDAISLAKIHTDAQRVELVDRIAFLETTLSRLSAKTQSLATEVAQQKVFERARTIQEPLNFRRRAESDAEGYLREFGPICDRVELMREAIESGAGTAGQTRLVPEGIQQ